MDGIAEMTDDFDNERIVLFSSVLTKTEVYDEKLLTQWARDEFSLMLQRDNFSLVSQDERISDKSRAIRDYYEKKQITLDAADCIHLARAILYKADAFYTLDGSSGTPKRNALLPLNGNVAGYPLVILKPHSQQGSLFTGIPKLAVSSAVPGRAKPRRKSK